MIYAPAGAVRPNKRQVLDFLSQIMAADVEEAAKWEKETFVCQNGNVEIYGEYYPVEHAKGCAVLAHGFGQNRYILLPQQAIFREMGFDTILFDERAFGESKEKYCTFGVKEAKDIACVVDFVKEKCGKDTKIVLLGVSMGAAASMMALEHTGHIDYLVEDCGFADVKEVVDSLYGSFYDGEYNKEAKAAFRERAKALGIAIEKNRPVEAVKKTNVPVCIFHGTADGTIGMEHAEKIYKACKNPKSRLALFEGKEHALCVTDRAVYKAVLQDFLKEIG